jgi:hypothetical protein
MVVDHSPLLDASTAKVGSTLSTRKDLGERIRPVSAKNPRFLTGVKFGLYVKHSSSSQYIYLTIELHGPGVLCGRPTPQGARAPARHPREVPGSPRRCALTRGRAHAFHHWTALDAKSFPLCQALVAGGTYCGTGARRHCPTAAPFPIRDCWGRPAMPRDATTPELGSSVARIERRMAIRLT